MIQRHSFYPSFKFPWREFFPICILLLVCEHLQIDFLCLNHHSILTPFILIYFFKWFSFRLLIQHRPWNLELLRVLPCRNLFQLIKFCHIFFNRLNLIFLYFVRIKKILPRLFENDSRRFLTVHWFIVKTILTWTRIISLS